MKLFFTSTSPFVRKVRIVAHELDLHDLIELVCVDPWTDGHLRSVNPLGKVPSLITENGTALFESAVICEFLNSRAEQRTVFPTHPDARLDTLLLQALADGAMAAMGRLFAEEQRPERERSSFMINRFVQAREAALDWLEARRLDDRFFVGEIATAALLGYLDFRWPYSDWRSPRPRVARWFELVSLRHSMKATVHYC